MTKGRTDLLASLFAPAMISCHTEHNFFHLKQLPAAAEGAAAGSSTPATAPAGSSSERQQERVNIISCTSSSFLMRARGA